MNRCPIITPRISWAFQLQLPIARLCGQHFQMSPGLGSPPAQLLPLRKTLNLPLPAQMTDSNPAPDVRPSTDTREEEVGRAWRESCQPWLPAQAWGGGMAGLFRHRSIPKAALVFPGPSSAPHSLVTMTQRDVIVLRLSTWVLALSLQLHVDAPQTPWCPACLAKHGTWSPPHRAWEGLCQGRQRLFQPKGGPCLPIFWQALPIFPRPVLPRQTHPAFPHARRMGSPAFLLKRGGCHPTERHRGPAGGGQEWASSPGEG